MKTHLFPVLILLTLAPFAAGAEEPPPAQADEPTATTAEDLPYGTGYEARQRLAQGEHQATQAQAPERNRTEARSTATEARAARGDAQRSPTPRQSRREAREQRPQRGPAGH